LEYEANLKASLTALGMTTAFDSARADFTPMVAKSPLQPVWLSDALHKVFIEVNEEGAQAAAASGFGIAGIPDEVVVDRPFFFAITDTWSGAILFMGVVYDPPQ
jgi:serpin B